MGATKGLYSAEFPVGTLVKIVERSRLEKFKLDWRYHHPLMDEQLAYAGRAAKVKDVGYFHGGDELYTLEEVPGIWHECCLEWSSPAGAAPA